tara:strand:+ start:393 stop:746 length:354 start_codon:yes stop_codon:yes gene_type:complete
MNRYAWKISDLLGDYEEPTTKSMDTSKLPVSMKKKTEWKLQADPERLSRMYEIPDETKFYLFVLELLELESQTQHHPRITIQYPKIKIELWTHSLDEVTDLDKEWAEKSELIYGDFQ